VHIGRSLLDFLLGARPRSVFFPTLGGAFSFLLKGSTSPEADGTSRR
jgi:hypothetical protein